MEAGVDTGVAAGRTVESISGRFLPIQSWIIKHIRDMTLKREMSDIRGGMVGYVWAYRPRWRFPAKVSRGSADVQPR